MVFAGLIYTFTSEISTTMKNVSYAVLLLLPFAVSAQNRTGETQVSEPRFGIGLEIMHPVWRIAAPDWVRSQAIQLQFTYRASTQRSWRAGYTFSTTEEEPSEYWNFRPTGIEVSNSGYFDRYHQLALGHQWYFGKGRLRPLVGADLFLGYEEVTKSRSIRTYDYDSLQVGSGFGEPINFESSWNYYEGLNIGYGGALGLEYRPHRNLSVQLSFSRGQFWGIPLFEENAAGYGIYRSGKVRSPQAGNGLFVQFEF